MTITETPPEVIDVDLSVPCQCKLFPDNPCESEFVIKLMSGAGELLCEACRPHCNLPPALMAKLQGWCCGLNLVRCRLDDGKHIADYKQ